MEMALQKPSRKISPFLWFDKEAEEAAMFYTSIFPDSSISTIARYPEGSPGAGGSEMAAGSVMTVAFQLDGQQFTALNGGPHFKFSEAISFVVHCETQEEVDHYWEKLCDGGKESQCGWLKDRFGLSWQIIPERLMELLQDTDRKKAQNVMKAILQMKKIDIAGLENAARQQ